MTIAWKAQRPGVESKILLSGQGLSPIFSHRDIFCSLNPLGKILSEIRVLLNRTGAERRSEAVTNEEFGKRGFGWRVLMWVS